MTLRDLMRETVRSLSANATRTLLTFVGIAIGVGAVIALISIGQGAEASIERSIRSIGSRLILVVPQTTAENKGDTRRNVLTESDIAALETASTIVHIAPERAAPYEVASGGKRTNAVVVGTTPAFAGIRNVELSSGVFLSEQDEARASKVTVVGSSVRDALFGADGNSVGKSVRIGHARFRVIGVAAPKSGGGLLNEDAMVFIPAETAERYLLGTPEFTGINMEVSLDASMESAEREIREILAERRDGGADLPGLGIVNQAQVLKTAQTISDTFTILLVSIASISLVVGGVGIMNMMLTNVSERMGEIGLRKALGTPERLIGAQFLAESVAITVSGGAVGILLGWGVAYAVALWAHLPFHFAAFPAALVFFVSALVGVVFGSYPALRAARLDPVEALRHE